MMKCFYNSKKEGFTLIEMLIVIVIIGILALMAVNSFGAERQRVQLSVAADALVSTLKEQMGMAHNGRQVSSATSPMKPGCFGVVISKNVQPGGTSSSLQTFTAPYVAVGTSSGNPGDFCDTTTVPPVLVNVPSAQNIVVQDIEQGSEHPDKLILVFKPPFGTVLEVQGDVSLVSNAHKQPTEQENPVKIFLKLHNDPTSLMTGVRFDALLGTVSRIPTSLPAQS